MKNEIIVSINIKEKKQIRILSVQILVWLWKYNYSFSLKSCICDLNLERYFFIRVLKIKRGYIYTLKLSMYTNHNTCNNFGDIFLTTSNNISQVIINKTQDQEVNLDNAFVLEDILVLVICTSSLTFIYLTIYIFYLIRDCNNEEDVIVEQRLKNLIYMGNSIVFKEKFKEIHQTVSLFYYSDQNIQLSYRILEVLSQFNLLVSLTIIECSYSINQILFIFILIIANPIVILILRSIYKIIEAIYRFRKIAAFISNFILIILLMAPNFVLLIFYLLRIQIQSEQYLVAIIVLGNMVISQVLIEPLTIFARIIVYRLIASSIQNMDMNPIYHLMHFFVMHNSLEEIFEEFTRI